ncbi:MAG: hotdog fold thioesterase [Chitinophagales bacterium]|nr:hotdog fold thioesterase [Chitinophagales bacterium]MDW8393764.1 hotdog fold thioesterase [Chitinophagales bacterium]
MSTPDTSTEHTVWYRPFTLEWLNQWHDNTLQRHLGIVFTEIGPDYLKAVMPVDWFTKQPAGLLHGGANVVLAESLGSAASVLCVDWEQFTVVGLEINANHLRAVRQGTVTGITRPIHLGRSTHIWEIKIYNDEHQLSCISRITNMILERR